MGSLRTLFGVFTRKNGQFALGAVIYVVSAPRYPCPFERALGGFDNLTEPFQT